MNSLPRTTQRRLKKLPQLPHVWEGDRRPVGGVMDNLEPDLQENGECIIWVDASEGFVRCMEIVRKNTGPEAMVRALLKAIENPHNPAEAARPKKIVVKDREIQFFLRGALQNLEIVVEYVPNLVLIDELWRNFEDMSHQQEDSIPSNLENLLEEAALEIWDQEPWSLLADHEIIKIDLNLPELETVYACVMGMLGKEYGVILYRSLDSLKQFRNKAYTVSDEEFDAHLESAFLAQDCWFINYSAIDEDEFGFDEDINLGELWSSDIQPIFGSIHPYEGMSPLRDEEEFLPIYLSLQALKAFVDEHEEELIEDPIKEVSKEYELNAPTQDHLIKVLVSTTPELTNELIDIIDELDDDDDDEFCLKDDLVPSGSIIALIVMSWDLLTDLAHKKNFYLPKLEKDLLNSLQNKGEGLPIILIQTSRPKGKNLIEKLKKEGGLKAICFNTGEDTYEDMEYEIGLLQTYEDNLYIFAQFPRDESKAFQAMRQWQKKIKKTDGYCGLLIAMGATGASRHNPEFKHMLGLFVVKLINSKDLGLGVLTLDFE